MELQKSEQQPEQYLVKGDLAKQDLLKVDSAVLSRDTLHRRGKSVDPESQAEAPPRLLLAQAWGALGVVAYLLYGVRKVVPVVRDGLGDVKNPFHIAVLVATLHFFAYVEGYRNFQKKFAPRVVCRAWIVAEASAAAPLWHKILAPAFCIGYFHGTKRRVIASWAITITIFFVVIGVKQLPSPYRAIIDTGVVLGLGWGILAVLVLFLQSLRTKSPPDFDPALPEGSPYTPPPTSLM